MTEKHTDTLEDFDCVPFDDSGVIHRHSRSFSLASKLLPADVRADIQTLYAWCRWCDDAVDTAPNTDAAAARLTRLRDDVRRIYRGEMPLHASSRWLADLVRKYKLDRQYPLALIEGMEMDLSLGQIKTEAELLEYCYLAAGVVGLMMCRVFGVSDPRAIRHAKSLGIAMQLTNIARDVREDWQRGRCYLPETWLLRSDSGVQPTDDDVGTAVKRLLELADLHYAIGNRGICFLPSKVRVAIRIASTVYCEIGHEIRRKDYRVMQGRTIVPPSRFAFAAFCGFFYGVTDAARGKILLPRRREDVFSYPSIPTDPTEIIMNDTKYVFYLGISLTSLMGCALFLLVMLNPKEASYAWLPVIYAVICLVLGIVTNRLAKQFEAPATVPIDDERNS